MSGRGAAPSWPRRAVSRPQNVGPSRQRKSRFELGRRGAWPLAAAGRTNRRRRRRAASVARAPPPSTDALAAAASTASPTPPPPGPRPCVRLCVRACVAAAAVCVDDADETPTASCCGRRVFFLRRWLPVVVRRRPRITGFGRAEFLSGGRRERWWPPSCFFFHLLPLHLSVRRCCRVAPAAFFPVKNTHTQTHTDTHRHTGAQCEWWEEAKQVDEGWEAARSG